VHEMSAWSQTSDKEGEKSHINDHSRNNFKKDPYTISSLRRFQRSESLNNFAAYFVGK